MRHGDIDKIGSIASGICALHCLICPILFTMFPIVSASFLANEIWDILFLLTSAILAFGSVCFGYRKHRKIWLFSLLSLAFFLIVVGHLYEKNVIGLVTLVLGGFTMSLCHIINWRLCRSCHTCSH